MELTKVRSVDTSNFEVHAGALKVDPVIHGFIAELKRSANDPGRRLFLSRVETREPAIAGPLQPTACAFSFTPAPHPDEVEVNLLLMAGGMPLPADTRAGVFNGTWGTGRTDATVVLSDTLLLRALIVPLLQQIYGRRRLTIDLRPGDLSGPAQLRAAMRLSSEVRLELSCTLSDGVITLPASAASCIARTHSSAK